MAAAKLPCTSVRQGRAGGESQTGVWYHGCSSAQGRVMCGVTALNKPRLMIMMMMMMLFVILMAHQAVSFDEIRNTEQDGINSFISNFTFIESVFECAAIACV
jgi:hypothetical protein